MEGGDRTVTTRELTEFAALYRRPVASFLAEADSEAGELFVLLYRQAAQLEGDEGARRAVLHYLDLCGEGIVLEELLGRASRAKLPSYAMEPPRSALQAIRQGEEVAREERARLGLGCAPIPSVGDLAASQGLWISWVGLPDSVSGLFFNHPSIGMGILVNECHQGARKRFSLAHEYGHALVDREHRVTATTTSNSADWSEKRANSFASTFLLPEAGIHELLASMDKGAPSREEVTVYDVARDTGQPVSQRNVAQSQRLSYREVVVVARHFGASYEATVFRLLNLKLVSKAAAELLQQQGPLASRYARVLELREPTEDPRRIESQVLQIALEAYSQVEISRGRLLEILQKLMVPPGEITEILAEAEAGRSG